LSDSRIAPLKGFRPDVQALRGLAVLLVVLYHADVIFRGGFIGVDVFFVISGFVIGRLILDELLTTDRLSFRAFYTRRFRRLLPALALMLVVVVLLSPLLAPLAAGSSTNGTAAASALFSANFYLYFDNLGGYFATAATLNPLLHTWSLAVEEQFYLLFPAALVLAWRHLGRRRAGRDAITTIRVLIAVLAIGSLALCLALSFGVIFPLRGLALAYYSPFTRAWEFCAGLALVVLPARFTLKRRVSRGIFGAIGYLGIVASALLLSDATRFPGYAAILPVVATAVAIHASIRIPRVGAPMIWLGDNSYGWYLWHWPLIVFAAAFWPLSGAVPLVIAAFAALIPAVMSRQLLEQRAIPRIDRRFTVVLTFACIALPFVAILASRPVTSQVADTSAVEELHKGKEGNLGGICGSGIPLGSSLPSACIINPDSPYTIALVGDSNAAQYATAVAGLAGELDARVELAAYNGCQLLDVSVVKGGATGSCAAYSRETLEDLQNHPRDVVIYGLATSQLRGKQLTSNEAELEALTSVLSQIAATGARTVFIDELPKPRWVHDKDWIPEGCSALAAIVDITKCGFPDYTPAQSPYAARSLRIETAAADAAGAERWLFTDLICPENRCVAFVQNTPVWNDAGHISGASSKGLVPHMADLLRSKN
jgi:peptidoglycan/LPS O-acetylase OafA/YrhL